MIVRYRPRTTSLTYGCGIPTGRATVPCETPVSEIASPTRFDPGTAGAARRRASCCLMSMPDRRRTRAHEERACQLVQNPSEPGIDKNQAPGGPPPVRRKRRLGAAAHVEPTGTAGRRRRPGNSEPALQFRRTHATHRDDPTGPPSARDGTAERQPSRRLQGRRTGTHRDAVRREQPERPLRAAREPGGARPPGQMERKRAPGPRIRHRARLHRPTPGRPPPPAGEGEPPAQGAVPRPWHRLETTKLRRRRRTP